MQYAYFQISVYGNEQNTKEPSFKNTMENEVQASYNFKAFKSEFFIFITYMFPNQISQINFLSFFWYGCMAE